jgi:hypothetical protein
VSTKTYFYSTTLTVTSCGVCQIPFAIPKDLYASRSQDGQDFFCPNGHRIHYAENENARLKRQLQAANDHRAAAIAQRDQAEASLRTTKGHVTRLRKRVIEGACPFCGQHLRDLERHVARQHKGEQAEAES